MKKIIYNPLVLVVIAILFNACQKDFLERYPLDQEVSSNFYSTEEDAMMALVSVYDALTYQSHTGYLPNEGWVPLVTVADVLSDDAFGGGGDANDGSNYNRLNTFTIPTTSPIAHSIWAKNYIGIYRANLFLEVIDGTSASAEFKKRSKAESKFMRAYFYVELVRFFENIPLLTETIKGPSQYSQEQNTPHEVYNQIALDLVEAIADLPEIVSPAEAGRITKWAAKGMLARTFLFYNGVYGGNMNAGSTIVDQAYALQQLEDIIVSSGHGLFEDYSHNFSPAGEFGAESVFEISYGDTPQWWDWNYPQGGHGNLAAQLQGPRVSGSQKWNRGWSFAPVSHKLSEFLKDDPRYEHTILTQEEIDGNLDIGYQHTGYFSKKYSSDAEHWGSGGQFELNRTYNHRVIRFSDVLLMAAELESPNKQQYLDRVRDRVGLPSVPATPENILKERRLELSLEGIRYFDVLRRGLAYASQQFSHTGIRGPNYVGDQQIFDVTFNPATKGFLPIPQTEIDLSAGDFRQNTGY